MKRGTVTKVLLALTLWVVILSVKYFLSVGYTGESLWTQSPHFREAKQGYSSRNPGTWNSPQQRLAYTPTRNIATSNVRHLTKQYSRLNHSVLGSASLQSHSAQKLSSSGSKNTRDPVHAKDDVNTKNASDYSITKYTKDSITAKTHISAVNNQHSTSAKDTKYYNPPWNCSGCFEWHYRLTLNQKDICATHGSQNIDLIFLIPSSHSKTEERSAIRETWASVTRNNTSNFRHVFFFGVTKDPARMRIVTEESRHFRDVVVMGFDDTYRNLTVKTLTMLRWLTENCAKARFFLKADDDMWVNTRTLMAKLNPAERELHTATAGTCAMSPKIIRNTRNKWSATHQEYPADEYPKYCSGTAYAGTVHVARQLVRVSRNVPFFHLEDVFVGLCLKQLGYGVKTLGGFHMITPKFVREDKCEVWKAKVATIHVVPPKVLREYWTLPQCGNRTDLLPVTVV